MSFTKVNDNTITVGETGLNLDDGQMLWITGPDDDTCNIRPKNTGLIIEGTPAEVANTTTIMFKDNPLSGDNSTDCIIENARCIGQQCDTSDIDTCCEEKKHCYEFLAENSGGCVNDTIPVSDTDISSLMKLCSNDDCSNLCCVNKATCGDKNGDGDGDEAVTNGDCGEGYQARNADNEDDQSAAPCDGAVCDVGADDAVDQLTCCSEITCTVRIDDIYPVINGYNIPYRKPCFDL